MNNVEFLNAMADLGARSPKAYAMALGSAQYWLTDAQRAKVIAILNEELGDKPT